jgi:hypothetical protein
MKTLTDRRKAFEFMVMKNRAYQAAGNQKDLMVLVDGPENDFVVMPVETATQNEFPFVFSFSMIHCNS